MIVLMLSAWIRPLLAQDYVNIVCAGDTGVSFYVEGWETSTFEWTVEGGTIIRDYGDSIIVDWGMVPGEYNVTVRETSGHGCPGPLKSATVLVSAPVIDLGEDAFICDGELFTIEPEGDFYSYEWPDGSTLPFYSTGEEGTIRVQVSDAYGCLSTDEMYLEVKDLPEVNLGRDTSLCGEEMLTLDAGNDAILYLWSTGEASQMIDVFQGLQEVWVRVEDEFGCVNSDTLVISECDPEDYFSDMPTAFTPNGDGRNDEWRIEKLEAYPDAVVDIYDRWGNLIFRSEPGYTQPWDGRNMRGQLVPMDSYHFVILLNFGTDDRVNGIVTVIR